MLHLKNGLVPKDFEGYTVIIPSYSVINAAQLALDVLISSKKMERIGQITDFSLVPVFGHSAFQHNPEERAASCELYADKENKLLAIQLRTLMLFDRAGLFHKNLAKLLKEEVNVGRVIVMSTSVHEGEEEDLPIHYTASETFKTAYKKDLEALNWKEVGTTEIVGGGNDKLLFKVFELYEIPVMIFYRFVGLPTDAVQKEIVFEQVNDLVVNFLKAANEFKLVLPIGWHTLIGYESGEMMY